MYRTTALPVDAVFSHGGFIWLLRSDVALVFLDSGLERTGGLPKKIGDIFWEKPTDLVLCLDSSLLLRSKVVFIYCRKRPRQESPVAVPLSPVG